MNREIKKIEQALRRQRERTATFVDIEFLDPKTATIWNVKH